MSPVAGDVMAERRLECTAQTPADLAYADQKLSGVARAFSSVPVPITSGLEVFCFS